MRTNEIANHLEKTLQKLEEMQAKVLETSSYNDESRKLRLLAELIKEQLKNENTRSATRTIR
jgi:hypothetical protein